MSLKVATDRFSVLGRTDHHEGGPAEMLCRGSRQLYLTSRAWSQAGNERQEHRWVICPQDSPVLIRACVFRLRMCDLFLLSLNYSLHIMCIAFAHNAPFGPFGLDKLYPSRVSYAHYVTTNAFGVTMQMSARICIIRRMIWLFGTSHYRWLFRRSGFWIFIMGRDKMFDFKSTVSSGSSNLFLMHCC